MLRETYPYSLAGEPTTRVAKVNARTRDNTIAAAAETVDQTRKMPSGARPQILNHAVQRVDRMPSGGVKQSGPGREGIRFVMEEMTDIKYQAPGAQQAQAAMTTDASTSVLHVLRDPPLDGPTNMARDEHLLYSDRFRRAAIRIYGWSPPTISLGYFQRFEKLGQLPDELRQLAVVRRLTGGGAILHDREVTYCLVIDDAVPATRQAPVALYRLAHRCWHEAIAADVPDSEMTPDSYPFPSPRSGPFFCFEKPGRTDLIVGARKLLGSAQRRIRGRVLQHGSLLLGRRFAAHPGADLGEPPAERVERWIEAFLTRLARSLALEPSPTDWTGDELNHVKKRRARYTEQAWTRRR